MVLFCNPEAGTYFRTNKQQLIMTKALLLSFIATAPLMLTAQTDNYANGSTVADFTVTDTHGQVHNLNAYAAAGKYVLLDFFFYDCPPCQANAPYYSELYETYGCNGGNLICIEVNNGTDTDARSEAFSEDFATGYAHPPVVGQVDGDALTNTFGVSAFPTFALISPAKIMLNRDIYPISSMNTFVNAFPANSGINVQSCAVGIDEQDQVRFDEIYPVPSNGTFNLKIASRSNAKLTVRVLNTLGQTVHTELLSGSFGNSVRPLDLTSLSDGQYVLQLNAGANIMDMQRIVIAH